MKRIHVLISGDVQGVSFRYSLYSLASLYNIKGWAKNLQNSKLEAVFEGSNENINKILEFCKRGPFLANVKSIEFKEEKFIGEGKFKIL